MKKTLSLILALLMSVSCASAIFADDAAISDEVAVINVEETAEEAPAAPSPYKKALEFLNTYEIMVGNEAGDLMAEKELERYEMALLMGRIMTGWVSNKAWEDFEANDSQFSDLKGSKAEKFYGAMSYVNQKGVICGYPDGSFKPEQVVTYREALTMAVRALGYKPANWPWDYIEKAVNLGLTAGIVDVPYTAPINRGIAAQIVYNTLFADGSKLALGSIGTGFGWVDVLVTSSVITKVDTAKYAVADYGTPNGYVTIQVINADGTLDSTLYYVKASALDADAATHGDEIILGTPYSVLMAKDSKDNYVEIVDAEKIVPVTYVNAGLTDDKGEKLATEVAEYLATKKLVSKYNKNVLTDKNHDNTGKEIIVVNPGIIETVTKYDYKKTPYAFDWATGNILNYAEDKDGKVTTSIAWYYNKAYDMYFKDKTELVNTKTGVVTKVVGLDILDEADVAEMKKEIAKACEVIAENQAYTVKDNDKAALYSTLDVYTTAAGAYGVYEAYSYGLISAGKAKCSEGHELDAFKINGTVKAIVKSDDHIDGAWWQADTAALITDADGKIVTKYAIYNYNETTKELKVIKTIEPKAVSTDVDTYSDTGIVRGYSLKDTATVTIGDVTLPLSQNFGSYIKDKDGLWKAAFTEELDKVFNQFVTYSVLDGEVTEIEITTAKEFYIVVEGYAGISKDGYVVVDGYSTDDLTLTRFRVAVYDSWNNGDIFWYGMQNNAEDYFVKGNVYKVRSYDNDKDVYFVDALGEVTKALVNAGPQNIEVVGVDFSKVAKTSVTLGCESGYRTYTADGTTSIKKVSSSDKYVFICNIPVSNASIYNYMPVVTYTGAMANGWSVTGDKLVGGADKGLIILTNVNKDAIVGFKVAEEYKNAGLVMVLSEKVLDKYYDIKGLNGETTYADVLVFNFKTGEVEYNTNASNIKPTAGTVYRTVDAKLISEYSAKWSAVWAELVDTMTEKKVGVDTPVVKNAKATIPAYIGTYALAPKAVIPEKALPGYDGNKDVFSVNVASELQGIKVNGAGVKGLVDNLAVFAVETKADGTIKDISALNKDSYKKLITDNNISAMEGYVLNKGGDYIVYVVLGECATSTTGDVATTTLTNAINVEDKVAVITGYVDASSKTEVVNGNTTVTYTVADMGFAFAGALINNSNHNTIETKGYFFDYMPRCDKSGADKWETKVDSKNVWDLDILYIPYIYGDKCTAAEKAACECELMKAFEAAVAGVSVVGTKAAGDTAYTSTAKTVKVEANFGNGATASMTVELSVSGTGALVAKFVDCNILGCTAADIIDAAAVIG